MTPHPAKRPVFNHFLDQLPARLEAALASTERGYLTSVTLDVPMPDFPTPVELPDESIFWSRPAQGHFRLGVGRALRLAFAGVDRFEQLDQRAVRRDLGHRDGGQRHLPGHGRGHRSRAGHPTVVGVEGATTRIPDGACLTIDGGSGDVQWA